MGVLAYIQADDQTPEHTMGNLLRRAGVTHLRKAIPAGQAPAQGNSRGTSLSEKPNKGQIGGC